MNNKCLNIIKKIVIAILAILAVIAVLAIFYLTVDFLFKGILSYTSRAVLANFIVFATIIFIISKFAIKPNELLEKAQKDIENSIKKSEQVKLDSQEQLLSTQNRIKNIEVEVEEIIQNSKTNAQNAGAKILDDANKIAISTKEDIKKTIQNNQYLTKNDIIRRTSSALIEIAKTNIINELNKNPQLHDKLIDESIQTISLNEQIKEV
ncbi:MAG: ATP synthase F0 subunit B [Cyanobacteria bacterium SIG27]|nr:ATP synthase F0 subunit B [Cyanobacteria bacterium SIG27]